MWGGTNQSQAVRDSGEREASEQEAEGPRSKGALGFMLSSREVAFALTRRNQGT